MKLVMTLLLLSLRPFCVHSKSVSCEWLFVITNAQVRCIHLFLPVCTVCLMHVVGQSLVCQVELESTRQDMLAVILFEAF